MKSSLAQHPAILTPPPSSLPQPPSPSKIVPLQGNPLPPPPSPPPPSLPAILCSNPSNQIAEKGRKQRRRRGKNLVLLFSTPKLSIFLVQLRLKASHASHEKRILWEKKCFLTSCPLFKKRMLYLQPVDAHVDYVFIKKKVSEAPSAKFSFLLLFLTVIPTRRRRPRSVSAAAS